MNVEGAYFLSSGVLYGMAKQAYERTKSAPSDTLPGQDDALTALLFCSATLDAFISELAFHAHSILRVIPIHSNLQILGQALDEVEESRGSVRLKYVLAKTILSGKPYDKGAQPYQDFDLLFRIRDAIVHLKPQKIIQEPHKIVKALRIRNLCEPHNPHARTNWLGDITTRAVARWSCNVVHDMVCSLKECFLDRTKNPPSPFMMIEFLWNQFDGVD